MIPLRLVCNDSFMLKMYGDLRSIVPPVSSSNGSLGNFRPVNVRRMTDKSGLLVLLASGVLATFAVASPESHKLQKDEVLPYFLRVLQGLVNGFLKSIVDDPKAVRSNERPTWPTLIRDILIFNRNTIFRSALLVAESSIYAAVEYGIFPLDKIVEANENASEKDEEEIKSVLRQSKELLGFVLVRLDVALDAIKSVAALIRNHASSLLKELLESMEARRESVRRVLSYTERASS